MKLGIIFVLTAAMLSGCVSMSSDERAAWRAMEREGGVPEPNQKSVVAAGALNLLPGIGNFYLASGTDESGQMWVGVANLLLWPVSPIWGVPQAAIDAQTINRKNAVRHGGPVMDTSQRDW
ncbi:MAG: hypothetical protein WD009_07055 [Phycisphaeraceae bacterium]